MQEVVQTWQKTHCASAWKFIAPMGKLCTQAWMQSGPFMTQPSTQVAYFAH